MLAGRSCASLAAAPGGCRGRLLAAGRLGVHAGAGYESCPVDQSCITAGPPKVPSGSPWRLREAAMSSVFIAFVAATVRGGEEEYRIVVLLGGCGARCHGGLRPWHRRAPVVFRFH